MDLRNFFGTLQMTLGKVLVSNESRRHPELSGLLDRIFHVPSNLPERSLTLFCVYQKVKKSTYSIILNSQL